MKLITKYGELSLPENFSIEMALSNPFLSDDGDASIPASIPASPENLRILRHVNRIDNANMPMKKIPARLEAGAWHKTGMLIIDSVQRESGIDVSFAVENSDMYSQYKNVSLKTLFADKVKDDITGVDNIMRWLTNIHGGNIHGDMTIFPVYITDMKQMNNEFDGYDFVYKSRTVQEGDTEMGVPDGYGISPFLFLHRLIEIAFELMGYQVTDNCFASNDLRDIVVLNNCSDTICGGKICYADLVPSCTVSEFVDWLMQKFCVYVRINSSAKKVSITKLQDVLSSGNCDIDITDKIRRDYNVRISESERVVLQSSTSLNGASPAAETFDELMDKYKFYFEVSETEFATLEGNSPRYWDCLVLRKAEGMFYKLCKDINSDKGLMKPVLIGTNYFKYDRKNADQQKTYSAIDEMPTMKQADNGDFYPYIGDRLHYHTTFDMSESSQEQKIIICWKNLNDRGRLFGTTQKWDRRGEMQLRPFSLNTYDIYDYFWKNYNELLLNNATVIEGVVDYSPKELLDFDITKTKLCAGQRLIQHKLNFNVGNKTSCANSEFIVIKNYLDKVKDDPILPGGNKLRWVKDTSQKNKFLQDKINALNLPKWYHNNQEVPYNEIEFIDMSPLGDAPGPLVNPLYYRALWNGVLILDMKWTINTQYSNPSYVEYTDSLGNTPIFISPPQYHGEISHKWLRNVKAHVYVYHYRNYHTNLQTQGVDYRLYETQELTYTGQIYEWYKGATY